MHVVPVRAAMFAMILCMLAPSAWGGQPLETESARLVKRGTFVFEGGFEHQTSIAGTEAAIPFAFEYGIADRLELTVEPVLYTAVRDRGIRSQTGPGDLEVTLTTLLSPERAGRPAVAFAGEVKLPTARNTRIGTGKTDFSGTFITSKRLGVWDAHLNLGYTVIGRPAGAQVNNVASIAVAGNRYLSTRLEFVSEAFGSTPAAKEGGEGQATAAAGQLTPELSGGELVGALGLRFHPSAHMVYALGVSIDNNKAVLVHPGITLKW